MTQLLDVSHLTKRFGGLTAVNDVSFSVGANECTGLIGPNGAGKSTLLGLLTGVQPPTGGTITFEGRSLAHLRPHHIAQKGIARTYQNIRLFRSMSVLDNVLVGAYWRMRTSPLLSFLGWPSAVAEGRRQRLTALALLDLVGLQHRAEWQARDLPYGQQKRLEVARALAAEPRLLLLDEPAAGLNTAETEQFLGLLMRLQTMGMAIMLVEHNVDLVMEVSARVLVLNFGSLIAADTPSGVQQDPGVIAAYLGGPEE